MCYASSNLRALLKTVAEIDIDQVSISVLVDLRKLPQPKHIPVRLPAPKDLNHPLKYYFTKALNILDSRDSFLYLFHN